MRLQTSRRIRRQAPGKNYVEQAAQASEQRLREIVEILSVPRSYTRERDENRRIARWIAEELSGLGFPTRLEGRYDNVVALPREAPSGPLVLVGAHYDSVPRCPGADDNASAVAALLHCAELLARHAAHLPVCFVAFNREEDGLLGSADFATGFLPRSSLKVRMAHVLEMVGYCDPRAGAQHGPPGLPVRLPKEGDFLALLANWHSRREATRVLRLSRSYFRNFPVMSLKVYFRLERLFPVLLRSDHASFWEHRVPSLLWTDTSEFRNPHYHEATDTPDTLDYAYLKRVTQLLYITVVTSFNRR